MGEGRRNWSYKPAPEPHICNRTINLPRGKVIGGYSSINGTVYIHGQREDYDGWAKMGNSG